MACFVKHQENRRTYYLIPLPNKFDGKTAYLDLTERARNALNKDRRHHYPVENGPSFGIEILHAKEYAEHVSSVATKRNLHKFNTRKGYAFFISALTDDQIKREEVRRVTRR